jgi:hypothetical protein
MSTRPLTAGAIAGSLLGAATLLWYWWPRVLFGSPLRGNTGDGWILIHPARFVAAGAYPYLYTPYAYRAGSWPYPPGVAVLFAPVAWLIDALGLDISEPPLRLANPSAWAVLGPALVVVGATLGPAVVGLGRRVGARHGCSLVALVVAAGGFTAAVQYGHPEDVLALVAMIGALGAAIDRRWRRVGLLLGAALLCKQWAIVLVPLLVARAPAEERRRLLLTALAVPAVPIGICLLFDPIVTIKALTGTIAHPVLGHRFPWIPSGDVVGAPIRIVGLVVVGVLGWRWGRTRAGLALVASAGLLMAARVLSEPVPFSYYVLQWSVFVLIVVASTRTRPMLWAHGLCLTTLCLWFASHPTPWLWWPVACALAAPGIVVLVRAAAVRVAPPEPSAMSRPPEDVSVG